MNYSTSKLASRFSVNVPQSVLFSDDLVSLADKQTRIQELESALESIFAVENQLTILETIKVQNMQREIDKINQKYAETNRIMIVLDEQRISNFQERIEAIYLENKPTSKEFIQAERLMQEREQLLLSCKTTKFSV